MSEPASYCVRCALPSHECACISRYVVKLYRSSSHAGIVLALASGPRAAAWAAEMGSIGGARWVGAGSDLARAHVLDKEGLPELLRGEGYDVDAGDYERPRVV